VARKIYSRSTFFSSRLACSAKKRRKNWRSEYLAQLFDVVFGDVDVAARMAGHPLTGTCRHNTNLKQMTLPSKNASFKRVA